MLFIGCILGWLKSITIKSAFFPRLNVSQLRRPIALAPPKVAILSTSLASTAEASFSRYLARAVVKNISLNISNALLLAGPSVPRARFIPFFIKRLTGAIPLASFKLEAGFKTMDIPLFSKTFMSESVI